MIEQFSQYRYIDPKKLTIEFEVLIYNNVYATYTYHNDAIFAVEIYNSQLAAMQKQLFDFVWNQAQPMRFIDARGATELVWVYLVLHDSNPQADSDYDIMRLYI